MHNLELTQKAQSDYQKIGRYLMGEWGIASVIKFRKKFNLKLKRIVGMPGIGTIHYEKGLLFREIPLTKQNTLVYRVKEDKIIIYAIFDNRQNPIKKYQF
ncbi:MAG: type II toxin-antitoxin system RelE/ParE family toxin [Dysgonamonadaceae bacterium]|jgi:plasmid stabilization system protein ParE|nr:type II toxin-antitoxin system RelE/ParE family toxin [Dysgonamonadaceae bacterium]